MDAQDAAAQGVRQSLLAIRLRSFQQPSWEMSQSPSHNPSPSKIRTETCICYMTPGPPYHLCYRAISDEQDPSDGDSLNEDTCSTRAAPEHQRSYLHIGPNEQAALPTQDPNPSQPLRVHPLDGPSPSFPSLFFHQASSPRSETERLHLHQQIMQRGLEELYAIRTDHLLVARQRVDWMERQSFALETAIEWVRNSREMLSRDVERGTELLAWMRTEGFVRDYNTEDGCEFWRGLIKKFEGLTVYPRRCEGE